MARVLGNPFLLSVGVLLATVLLLPTTRANYYRYQAGQTIQSAIPEASSPGFLACSSEANMDPATRLRLENAFDTIEQAIRLSPKDPQNYLLQGMAACLLGEYTMAETAYKEYTELRPQNPLGHLEYGLVLDELEQPNAAAREWLRAGLSEVQFLAIGNAEKQKHNYSAALIWYKRSININPKHIPTLMEIGQLNQELGDNEAAIQAFHMVLKIDPRKFEADYGIAGILEQDDKDYIQVLSYYKDATVYDPLPVKAYYGIGKIYLQTGKPKEALEAYRKAIAIIQSAPEQSLPLYREMALRMGEFFLQQELSEDASIIFQLALKNHPEPNLAAWAYWGLGRATLLSGEPETAKNQLEAGLDQGTSPYIRSQIYLSLGQIAISEGEKEQGFSFLSQALQYDPDNQGLYLYAADQFHKAGRLQAAYDIYQKYLEKWPEKTYVHQLLDALGKEMCRQIP